MLKIVAIVVLILAGASAAMAGQQRYVRAEENQNHDLIITTSTGERIELGKNRDEDGEQSGFDQITISPDGRVVGWLARFSYPMLVEAYRDGRRKAFKPSIVAWNWCFVDGGTKIAARSTTLHGPQHAVMELWDVATEQRLARFTWMEGESYPRAPAWAAALDREYQRPPEERNHVCSTAP